MAVTRTLPARAPRARALFVLVAHRDDEGWLIPSPLPMGDDLRAAAAAYYARTKRCAVIKRLDVVEEGGAP